MNDILVLVVFALFEGYREQLMKRSGARWWERTIFDGVGFPIVVQRTRVFTIFTVAYHVPLAIFWTALCWKLNNIEFVPAFALVEDWAFFRFHPDDKIDETDWAHKHFGGKTITMAGESLFLPYLYGWLALASAALYLGKAFLWSP